MRPLRALGVGAAVLAALAPAVTAAPAGPVARGAPPSAAAGEWRWEDLDELLPGPVRVAITPAGGALVARFPGSPPARMDWSSPTRFRMVVRRSPAAGGATVKILYTGRLAGSGARARLTGTAEVLGSRTPGLSAFQAARPARPV